MVRTHAGEVLSCAQLVRSCVKYTQLQMTMCVPAAIFRSRIHILLRARAGIHSVGASHSNLLDFSWLGAPPLGDNVHSFHNIVSSPRIEMLPICRDCVLERLEGPGINISMCPRCKAPLWKKDLVHDTQLEHLLACTQRVCPSMRRDDAADAPGTF